MNNMNANELPVMDVQEIPEITDADYSVIAEELEEGFTVKEAVGGFLVIVGLIVLFTVVA